MPRSLNQFHEFRNGLIRLRIAYLERKGMVIDPTCRISLSSRFALRRKGDIAIGRETLIAFRTLVASFDSASGDDRPIRIGRNCFIGAGSVICPGVTIGDGSIVAAGAVVTADVPPTSIAAGNPARILRSGIEAGAFGRLAEADENSRRMWRP